MKDYIIGLAFAVVLMFSFNSTEFTPTGRNGTQLPGESGVVLPGGGAEPVVFAASPDTEAETCAETTTEAISEAIPEVIEKEQTMNDMLLMFWHGVAAVLIVETGLLAAATVWLKIKMAAMDKRGVNADGAKTGT